MGYTFTYCRSKQRSDKKETKFLIPRSSNKDDINFAGVIDLYLNQIKGDLGIFSGKAFWTGKELAFINLPLGKNEVSEVPKLMAKFLEKENIKGYTFHSCRRSSATAAADSGASPQQMIDFYGWKNCQIFGQAKLL